MGLDAKVWLRKRGYLLKKGKRSICEGGWGRVDGNWYFGNCFVPPLEFNYGVIVLGRGLNFLLQC